MLLNLWNWVQACGMRKILRNTLFGSVIDIEQHCGKIAGREIQLTKWKGFNSFSLLCIPFYSMLKMMESSCVVFYWANSMQFFRSFLPFAGLFFTGKGCIHLKTTSNYLLKLNGMAMVCIVSNLYNIFHSTKHICYTRKHRTLVGR